MRKFTSFLLLLFMAMVVKAQTEAVVKMTYVDYNQPSTAMGEIAAGASARAGYNKISGGSVAFANTGWGENKITYIQVDASCYTDDIVSAKLTVEVSGSSDNKRTTGWGVGYNSSDWSADMTYETADKTITTIGDLLWTSTKSSTTFETKEFDILDAFKNDEDKVVTLLVYETAAAGGYIKNPQVTIEVADASTITTYTVKYVDGEGNDIKESAVCNIVIGETASVTDEDKADIYTDSKKYIYVSCDNESITTVADAASNVMTVTFREAETYSYTANAVDGEGNVLEVLGSWSYFEGETVKVPYSRYILQDGILYEKGTNSSEYRSSLTLSADNQVLDIVYSTSSITNAVYFNEAEDIEGLTKHEDGYIQTRMSKGAAGYATTDLTTITTLPAGVYTLTSATRSGTTNFYANSDLVLTVTSTGSVVTNTSEEFTFYEDTEIKVSAGSKSNYFDYLLICRTGDAPVRELVIDDTDAEGKTEYPDFAPEYSSYSSVVYNRELNTGYTYGLICLPFAPDAESLKNFQFYALSSASGDAITFEEVNAPEAARPYLYSIKEGATRTNCITGGATTFDLNDPTAVNNFAAGTWELVGSLENASIDCTDQTTTLNYAFNPAASTLHKVTKTLTVYPYTAYVRNNIATSAATMRVYISGPTGIKEISRDAIEGFDATEGMFDLQGRAMSKPMKGQIYIQNGVKKIKR